MSYASKWTTYGKKRVVHCKQTKPGAVGLADKGGLAGSGHTKKTCVYPLAIHKPGALEYR
jgi:hypothetical protein